MVIHLGLPLLTGSSSLPGSNAGRALCFPIWPCCERGLPCPRLLPAGAVRSYRTVSPLPVSYEKRQAVCFLWHFPGVAPTGRYPASCPVQPGLSSTGGFHPCRDHPSHSAAEVYEFFRETHWCIDRVSSLSV